MCMRPIVMAIALAASATVLAQQPPPRPKVPPDARPLADPSSTRARQQAALRQGGLRAAAAVTGHYEGVVRSHSEVVPADLTQLVKESQLIIVGTIVSHRSFLDQRERMIHTSYEVRVDDAWKGLTVGTGSVVVSIPGGRVGFPDGSYAHINTPDMPLPTNGQRYVLFLGPARHQVSSDQRLAAKGPIYALRSGSVGLYLVRTDGRILPRSPIGDAVRRQVERLLLPEFRLAVRDASDK